MTGRPRLLACLAVAVLVLTAAPASAVPAIPGPPGYQSELSSPAKAAVRAHALLAYLPLPATAAPSKGTPLLPGLHDMPSQNRVVRSRWWTYSGSSAQLAAFLAANIPVGFNAPVISHGQTHLSYSTQYGLPPHAFLDVTYLPGARQTQIRVDAEVIWLPKRSPLEFIPYNTSVVDIDVRPTFAHSGLPSRHLVYRGPELRGKLIYILDGDPTAPPGETGCPPVVDGWTTTLTFRIGHRVVVFRSYDGGCEVTSVTVNGKAEPSLQYGDLGLTKYIVGLPYPGEAP